MENKSFLRKMYNKSNNILYKPIENFNEAKKCNDSVVIFEGDYGGTIYLTCPIKFVKCNEEKLNKLLKFIDKNYWNDLDGAGVYYELIEVSQGVAGGMNGGFVIDGIWIHPEIIKLGIDNKIKEILTGEIS